MHLSASKITCYQDCPKKFYFRYVERLRQIIRPANMAFGTAMHSAFETLGKTQLGIGFGILTPTRAFLSKWEEEISDGTDKEPEELDKLKRTGVKLTQKLCERWQELGFVPLMHDGKAFIEWRFSMPLGSRDTVTGYVDNVSLDPEAQITLLDAKTAQGLADPDSLVPMDQDVLYTIAFEEFTGMTVDQVGYLDLIKRSPDNNKKGSEDVIWVNPMYGKRPTNEVLAEFRAKWEDYARDIRAERFPREPRQRHNSPCNLCEFRAYCWHGDKTGLTKD